LIGMRCFLVAASLLAAAACDDAAIQHGGCELAADCPAGSYCQESMCVGGIEAVDDDGEDKLGAVVGNGGACSGSVECGDDSVCVLGRCVAGCGQVTTEGVCDGDVLVFCVNEGEAEAGLVVLDCGAMGPSGSTTTCADIDGAHMKGCAVLPGERCLDVDDGRFAYCRGDEPACVYDLFTGIGVCVEQVGRCTPSSEPQCVGDILVEACTDDGQPLGTPCSAEQGTCKDGACRDLPAGQMCDDWLSYCAAGLRCASNGVGAMGTCVAECIDADAGAC
jgi:hypothetical protein